MTWEEVCADPSLQDLPYKIELNRWGKIEMSPASRYHGIYQAEITHLLRVLRPDGVVATEAPVETGENTKVPDVSWTSRARHLQLKDEKTFTIAPEICVEVVSPGNTAEELLGKRDLYFGAGALEFWLCDELGKMSFFSTEGSLTHSVLCPEFPPRVEIVD